MHGVNLRELSLIFLWLITGKPGLYMCFPCLSSAPGIGQVPCHVCDSPHHRCELSLYQEEEACGVGREECNWWQGTREMEDIDPQTVSCE